MPRQPTLLKLLTRSLALGATAALPAQVAPAPAPATDEVIELSPFTVNTSKDTGYFAENTLAGSRLNTKLRDTPGSVSVFTPEFIADLGITDMAQLIDYSVNAEVDTASQRAGANQNEVINAQSLTRAIQIRGLDASQGIDFFQSITPMDPYRIGRYEDSRGPNSILFGIGSPGGLLNQTSKTAVTHRDSASIQYGVGSWERSRLEVNANKVLRKDKLAVAVAALDQENGGWRDFDFKDSERIYGAVTYRPTPRLTFNVMGETGRDVGAVITSYTQSEEVLAWYDNRQALGASAVTFVPGGNNPTAAQMAVGVVGRNGNRGGSNHRYTFIENDGTWFDAIGTYLSGTYNNAAVRAPDGTPGVTTAQLRLNDPAFFPYHLNAGGPGMFRDQSVNNYTITADWQIARDLFLNVGHNYQESKAVVNLMIGQSPVLRGEANRTLGVGGPTNPYAGQMYLDGDWRRDTHDGDYKETRVSLSYNLDTGSKWLGTHRIAGLVSRSEQYSYRVNSWLVLAGRPFNADPTNVNNRITVRNYLTEGDFGTYRVGDWRSLPGTFNVGGQEYTAVFANEATTNGQNNAATQETDSALAVVQSHFLNGRFVTTLGYREDRAEIAALGFRNDPILGDIVDPDPAKRQVNDFTGRTHTTGAIFHATDWLSLIANASSSVGVPAFNRTVLPNGGLPPPPEGEGRDYGVNVDLLGGRISAKVVYFTAEERGRSEALGAAGQFNNRNRRVLDAFATALVGSGRPFSQSQWDALSAQYNPSVSGALSDFESEGYEARITANVTPNWRLIANYSYTDSGRKNLYGEALPWYGFKTEANGLVRAGVTQNAAGQFVVDPNAFESNGTIAKWIELGGMNSAANLATLTTSANVTVAQEILNLADFVNENKQDQEKRWGLRPHKVSLFTAYDFTEGRLKGFSVGGGWRWRSANVIGTNSSGGEITGEAITSTDLMLRYTRKFSRLPGRVSFQLNVYNLLDRTDIIPQRIAISDDAPDGVVLPGGRGLGYSRFDLVTPREIRFTTTYSF